ncbi:hypothetical protein L3Q82_012209 [Scortum barcoo]|uniref:Uncharacterized protein n=1 Tax=Scortum barcoo TaxID=214431 RepID=A0ACB8W2W0_9TELE|nr:hypothetical protein L3Q82_012209 [Scortum barcoo]
MTPLTTSNTCIDLLAFGWNISGGTSELIPDQLGELALTGSLESSVVSNYHCAGGWRRNAGILKRRHCQIPDQEMESSGLVTDFVSPESTVTSLLSSSGHLRSSLLAPEHTTFRYRDKNYDSASAALDAYIADFERSPQNSKSLTGRLVLPLSPPSTPSRPRVSTLRNRDVLRERLTDRELDFLNLPVSSLHHRSNRDRLSMTTDELLSIPYDGSMPVTHTSAFIQVLLMVSSVDPGLLCQSGSSHLLSFSRPAHRTMDRLSSSHVPHRLDHYNPHPTRTPRNLRCRGRTGAAMLKPDVDVSVSCNRSAHRATRSDQAEPSSLHLPHWFTSNKTDMTCSGITSVPDLKYPPWIHRCDFSDLPPPTQSELWDEQGLLPPTASRSGAPSWVAELEVDDLDQTPAQVDSQQTLRDLRLQFAEQISLFAVDRNCSDTMEALYRDNKIESLIQKADQVLNSLSHETDSGEEAVSPLNTKELLLCSSSHHCPLTLDSAAGGSTQATTDGGAQCPPWSTVPQTQCCHLYGNSIYKQPGPVEALKQMLFRLQAVEAELQRQQPISVAQTITDLLQTEQTPAKQRPEAELESVSGGPSLQRALHHLSCLKVLVEEPRQKDREEKEEDEGHFSSSSTERLISTQQKPT